MVKVLKRNGHSVEFDKYKIINAIEKAMMETESGVDSDLSEKLADLGHKVIGIDNMLGGYDDNVPKNIEFQICTNATIMPPKDILDKFLLQNLRRLFGAQYSRICPKLWPKL